MAKERALTLEALRVMDAIDRRGSFAAAADELGRVPSALSYTMQKLEEELDVVLFDRSGLEQNSPTWAECCWSAVACCWKRRIS